MNIEKEDKKMGVPISEQETVIRFGRDSDECEIYTSDSTMLTKLDKLAAEENEEAPLWKVKEEHRTKNGHELVGKTYVTNKRLVSFRSRIVTRELTEEQKKELADRMRKAREGKKTEDAESPDFEFAMEE